MINCFIDAVVEKSVLLVPVIEGEFQEWLAKQSEYVKNLVQVSKFTAKPASYCLITGTGGELEQVLVGLKSRDDGYAIGALPSVLPNGVYKLATEGLSASQIQQAVIGWGLGSYKFTRYQTKPELTDPQLLLPESDQQYVVELVKTVFLVRDLLNTPTEDMHPDDLAKVAITLGTEFGASVTQIVGEELLKENFPAVHAVGRASVVPPRLLELTWGEGNVPTVVLVGKGVCFDSGGLDIKPSSAMEGMKMDMAGAAHVLGLARLIMVHKLPIKLKVIIPAVENLLAGNGYKPGDIIKTRKGITVEVLNTDAEGRLILADALTYALEFQPDLLIDFASLTGAALVALGGKIPAMFTNNDELAGELAMLSVMEHDPVWRLPLYKPYRKLLNSKIADIANISSLRYGGAITAALFLEEFVANHKNWVHFDIPGANEKPEAWQPEGGEATFVRAMFSYLYRHFK